MTTSENKQKVYEDIIYRSGLIADGCWSKLDSYDKAALETAFDLLLIEAISVVKKRYMGDNNREDMEVRRVINALELHFGL